MPIDANTCPLCHMALPPALRFGLNGYDGFELACQNCGSYRMSRTLHTVLENSSWSPSEHARISYGLKRMGGCKNLTTAQAESILRSTQLPDAGTLQDNLLLYLAQELPGPGEVMDLWAASLRASVGALSSTGVRWAIQQSLANGLVIGIESKSVGPDDDYKVNGATLTGRGWTRVEELLRSAKDSRKAFMAMKFGDPETDAVFRDCFKPAVAQTGFDLVRLDEAPRAGLIDDRLRLELRTSRFVIADLTHANHGAYWEAGFAEGLGRPVIYTCRKDVFDEPKTKPHFDTNHHLTVVWDPADLSAAAEQLKTVIRVTLPTEAVLS